MAENSNRPHFHGLINPADFSPFPKNPIIAGFFRQIGRAEELGSGVRNLFKYTKAYSANSNPQLIENDIFRIIVPLYIRLIQGDFVQVNSDIIQQATTQADKNSLLEFCRTPRSRDEMQNFMKLKNREHFRLNILRPLIKNGDLLLTIPDKPTSPKQTYYTNPILISLHDC